MDIETFYQHAREWQKDKETADRDAEILLQAQLADAWKGAETLIRETFPLDGIRIFELVSKERREFPHLDTAYTFYVALPGIEFAANEEEDRHTKGLITVILKCYVTYSFKVAYFLVSEGGELKRFENPYQAFLAAYSEIGLQPTDNSPATIHR